MLLNLFWLVAQALGVCVGVVTAVCVAGGTFFVCDNASRSHVYIIGTKLYFSENTMTAVHVCRVFWVGFVSLLVCASIVQATLHILT